MYHASKPLKTTFRKERDGAMAKNNYLKSNKITLVGWMDKVLNQTLIRGLLYEDFGLLEFGL
jgi:hypothetical protein